MKLLLAFCVLCFFFPESLGQDRFDITVVGSFRHDAAGITCDYCDCSTGCSTWVDNFTCSDFPEFGADDNQQRWGTKSGTTTSLCFSNSGVGFQGVTNVAVISNQAESNITRIGRITHYNNVIKGTEPERLRLTLTVTAPQLVQPFIIAYPLQFIETNNGFVWPEPYTCDPAIQRTTRDCDDRFSFVQLTVDASFVFNNIKYTLQVVGFLQSEIDLGHPIKQFVTRENAVSRADVYARIVTFCLDPGCGANQIFLPPPVCGCVCILSDSVCQDLFGLDWGVDNSSCNCVCNKNSSTCPINQPLNLDSCGCGCNITDAYCEAINPVYGAAAAPKCACDCSREKYQECYSQNPFYRPSQTVNCDCVCVISDDLCAKRYGDGYTADLSLCLCNKPGGDGLTDGDIAGIVIGSVAGALLLLCLMGVLAGTLVWLIRSGKIPGIYGYKIQDANFEGVQNSPFYADRWTVSNATS